MYYNFALWSKHDLTGPEVRHLLHYMARIGPIRRTCTWAIIATPVVYFSAFIVLVGNHYHAVHIQAVWVMVAALAVVSLCALSTILSAPWLQRNFGGTVVNRLPLPLAARGQSVI